MDVHFAGNKPLGLLSRSPFGLSPCWLLLVYRPHSLVPGMIITDNGFDALFAANRIGASVRQKSRTQQDVVMDGCAARY